MSEASDSGTLPSDLTPESSASPRGAAGATDGSPRLSAADILERIGDAVILLDSRWRIVYANREACRINQKSLQEFIGRIHWEEWPAAVGSEIERHLRRAMAERVEAHFEHRYVSGPYDVWLENDVYPTRDGLSIFYRDITARKEAEASLRRSREDQRLAVDAARLGTFYCEWPLDKIVWNDTCKEHFFLPLDAAVDIGVFYSLLHPDDREPTRRAIERAMAERVPYDMEYRTRAPDGRTRWVNAVGRFYYGPDGDPLRFDGVTLDVTERVERERRERFLAELAERARALIDPDAVIADAVRSVGRFLGVSRCVFADIDIAADTCTVPPDYRADESVASIAGTFPISAFGPFLTAEYEAGRTVAADDVRSDPARFPAEFVTAYDAIAIRAFIAAPVLHSARLVSVIAAHSAAARRWKPEEVALLQTVVERTWLTVEVIRQQQALAREAEDRREAHTRTARILESITDAFFTLDTAWRFTYVNDQSERIMGRARADLLGRAFWEEFPAAVGSTFEREYRRAVDEQVAVSFEEFYPPLDHWVEVRAYPSPDGLSVFYQDVTARRRAAEALRQSEERYRLLVEGARDYAMILMDTGGRVTGWNAGAERILGWAEAEVMGLPADLIFTPEDRAAGVPARERERAAAEGRALDLRWHLTKNGARFYADGIMEALHDDDGRLRGFAQVLRDATARKSLEDERERLADANRLLLDSTGEGIYGIDLEGRFTFVNRAAARMLGFILERIIGRDGHTLIHHTRPDGAPFPVNECPIYHAIRSGEGVHVEDDVFWREDGASFPVAYSAAPIFEHGVVQGAVVTFSDISARRALERERERVAERERNIAAHLQAALTPALPARVPGLALAKYYEAALDEAGVGGDFYDVFAVEKGRTALVVGDLAGKGLAAAAQVSTVRNMLRAFLYSLPTVAEAVTELNRVLSENNLLTGFATLFVGAYDSAKGRLQYVNCGQEPALVRRADTGAVELLDPTGPILGAIEGARYLEADVSLTPGDAAVIFTDGLTEVGATRTAMLGVEGVAALLGKAIPEQGLQPTEQVAELLALRLIAGVDAYAQAGARDDMCLLVGVVQ